MPIDMLHTIVQYVDKFDFEDIREKVIKELCQGEQSAEYLQGINDTLEIIKNMYNR